ncbi:hypothetical protein LJC21_01235 [Bacteroides sp. OttesenSCG-928-E20]|nr:hypothetical protein [Bacteroides sp. OttesenSCG-928-N06]MDL2299311.1 hypothetical protein [Bacteroides sp. OttesenSCG-928-E20]
MKQEDETYNRLVEQIKKTPPTLSNPQKLTADIIGCIEQLPQRRKHTSYKLNFAGWLSVVAAVFLLCLFVNEALFPFIHQENKTIFVNKTNKLPQEKVLFAPDMTLAEKKELLLPILRQKKEVRENRKSMWNN